MAKKTSAGILLYRMRSDVLEVFLVHPGGPFWANRDVGAWSIPKGEVEAGDDPLETARREFKEETGTAVTGDLMALTPLTQSGGKRVHAWAVPGDIDPGALSSNTFSIQWPPHSTTRREFPEVDKGRWFAVPAALEKILPGQRGFIDELQRKLASDRAGAAERLP